MSNKHDHNNSAAHWKANHAYVVMRKQDQSDRKEYYRKLALEYHTRLGLEEPFPEYVKIQTNP